MLFTTVVGDYINIMKTTFDFNFDFYPVLNSIIQKMETKRSCKIRMFSLITVNLEFEKKACQQLKLK